MHKSQLYSLIDGLVAEVGKAHGTRDPVIARALVGLLIEQKTPDLVRMTNPPAPGIPAFQAGNPSVQTGIAAHQTPVQVKKPPPPKSQRGLR